MPAGSITTDRPASLQDAQCFALRFRWWSRFGATTGTARDRPRAPAGAQDVPAGLVTTVRPASLQDANVFTLRSGGSATDPPLKPAR